MKVKHLLTGAAAIALLATPTGGVAAQDEAPEPQLYFSGVLNHDATENPSWTQGVFSPEVECPSGGQPMDAAVEDIFLGATLEASDPRISGTFDWVWSQTACWHEEGWPLAFAMDATYRITNDGGSWFGSGPGFVSFETDSEERPNDAFMATLTGTGDYEGLTAVIVRRREARPDQEPPWEDFVQGVIVNGPIPPASDFDGSVEARTWLAERTVIDEGQDDPGFGAQGVGIVLDGAVNDTIGALDDDLEGGVETIPETVADFLEPEDEEDRLRIERTMQALDAIGVAPEDTTVHHGIVGIALGEEEFDGRFQLFAIRYPGADPELLVQWFHPDNPDGPAYDAEGRIEGTVAEELQYGEHTVYAVYRDGVPFYTLIEGDVTLEVMGDGPGQYPDEAAVQAFFEALPDLASIDYEALEGGE